MGSHREDLRREAGPVSDVPAPRIQLLCAGAARGLVGALEGGFAAATGARIEARFGAVGAMQEALRGGAPCDVLVVTAAMVDALAAEGVLDGAGRADLGRVRTGIAVKNGHATPAIASAEALRAALEGADRLYFPDPERATAGIHFAGVLRRLRLHAALAPRFATFPNGATAMRALAEAREAAPLGCTQVTEILDTPGVQLVGPLPAAFELVTVYTAAPTRAAADPALARHFIEWLAGPASRALRRARGFEVDEGR